MKLVTYRTPVNYRVFCLQPWILIQKLPSIILALVCHLCLPQPLHTCEVLRVGSKWRYLVMIIVPSHAIPNDMLFKVLFAVISLSL